MRTLALFTSLLACSAGARAADWTGFYGGLNAGYGRAGTLARTEIAQGADYFTASDFQQVSETGQLRLASFLPIAGAQLGYNYHRPDEPELIEGLEADFQSARVRAHDVKSADSENFPGAHLTIGQSVKADWLATLRARIGLATEDLMFYATGGAAATRIKYDAYYSDDISPVVRSSAFRRTRIGWTLGAGAERRIAGRWSVKGEYLYVRFGKTESEDSIPGTFSPTPPVLRHSATLDFHLVRVGLNCRLF